MPMSTVCLTMEKRVCGCAMLGEVDSEVMAVGTSIRDESVYSRLMRHWAELLPGRGSKEGLTRIRGLMSKFSWKAGGRLNRNRTPSTIFSRYLSNIRGFICFVREYAYVCVVLW